MSDTPQEPQGRQGELGLTDAELWDNPFRSRTEVERRWFAEGAERLALDGPRVVPLVGRATCPVVILRFSTLAKINELPFRHALITAMDPRTNRLLAAPVIRPNGDLRPLPPTGEPPTPAFAGEAFHVDLRERLGLPWEPGEHIVTLILREEVSARIRIVLSSPGGYQDPEVVRYLEERARRSPPPAIFPLPPLLRSDGQARTQSPVDQRLPSFHATAASLELPDALGIRLSAPRVTPLSGRDDSVLRGSFRLRVQETDLVERPGGEVLLPEGAERLAFRPVAVVPINLLFTGSVSFMPVVVRLGIPSFSEVDRSSGAPVVEGTFAIPLRLFPGLPRLAETSFLYAFSGETMVGPVPIATVADDPRWTG